MIRYLARCVLPVAAPPIVDGGAVRVRDGRIEAVGRVRDVPRDGARDRDLGDVVLMPGPVNAHTHLELSWMADDRPAGGEWVAWVEALVALRGGEDRPRAERAAERALAGVRERGTAAVGDIANLGTAVDVLARSGLHGVVFVERFRLRAREAGRALAEGSEALENVRDALRAAGADGRVRAALAPHAPHTTSPALISAIATRARDERAPLSIHAAESAAEVTWLRDGTGPLADFYARRGLVDAGWDPPGVSPIAALERSGALGPRTLLVHAGHLADTDIELVLRSGATVVTCPRSNRYLGVPCAPVERLRAAGVRVALGTDSLASCPDLDPFAETAALRREHPGLAPAEALRIATLDGARALGIDDRVGAIAPGRVAAMAAVPLETPAGDPVETVTSGPARAFAVGVLAS